MEEEKPCCNYVNTALCFTGSKFKLLNQIIPEMDFTKNYFVDLFAGSGVVGFNVVNKYEKVLLNDIIKDLIEIHKEIIYNSGIFINKVKSLVVSKEDQKGFNHLRENYNMNNSAEGLYALMLCSTNNFMRFNKSLKYNQTFGKRTFSDSTQEKLNNFINYILPFRDKLIFTNKDFNMINIIKPSMIYIDPPYSSVQDEYGNISNKKISEAGYNNLYKKEDDVRLYNYIVELNKNKHSFMLSGLLVHDGKQSWIMNKLIRDGFKYKELNFNYNSVSKKGKKDSTEIIIMNY
jgi:DNA adenine methylase Dam